MVAVVTGHYWLHGQITSLTAWYMLSLRIVEKVADLFLVVGSFRMRFLFLFFCRLILT